MYLDSTGIKASNCGGSVRLKCCFPGSKVYLQHVTEKCAWHYILPCSFPSATRWIFRGIPQKSAVYKLKECLRWDVPPVCAFVCICVHVCTFVHVSIQACTCVLTCANQPAQYYTTHLEYIFCVCLFNTLYFCICDENKLIHKKHTVQYK